jgi:hypothetical protein
MKEKYLFYLYFFQKKNERKNVNIDEKLHLGESQKEKGPYFISLQ